MSQEKKRPIMEAIGIAFLTWKRYCQKKIFPYGITLKQFEVLRQLERKVALYPSEIADMLFCDRPTATVVIKNMEKEDWVKRELDSDDSRRIKITLKSAGLAKLKGIAWNHPDSKEKRFQPSSCFTRQEKEQLTKLLIKLNRHLKQIKEDTYG